MDKLPLSQLRPGMIIDEAVYTSDGKKLLLQHGNVITSKMIELLKSYSVDSLAVTYPHTHYISPSQAMAQYLKNFFSTHISQVAPNRPEGNINDAMVEVSQKARKIMLQLIDNEAIMEACVKIKLVDNEMLFFPAVHCCVHAVLLAGAMKMSDKEIYNVAAASLLQNFGLCEMPHLLEVENRDFAQEKLWKEHCQYGYYFAKECGIPTEVANLILCHHEQFDGSGFPKKLQGEDIPMGAKIINLCSEYDEMLYVKKYKLFEAVEYMYACGDGKYDSRVIDAFVMNIPLYSLGSIVRLSTKEVGVVVNIRKNIGPRPVIRICYNRFNRPISDTKVVDLGTELTIFIDEVLS